MNVKLKAVLMAVLILAAFTLAAGCSQAASPYDTNDAENYTVSVKYDANGGYFTTNTSVIVDSYNVADLAGSDGTASIALLSPDNAARGNDAFAAVNNGYFLAGWYAQRQENADGTYTYAGRWDFENDRLTVDAAGSYTSAEPVLTLYAAWVPVFEIEFYSLDSGEYLSTYSYDPNEVQQVLVPAWNEETGAIEMYKFPQRSGYTFANAYYDAEGTQIVDTEAVIHSGTVDEATGTAENAAMKLYIAWSEGEWYHIYNVEQFLDNASVAGSYVIHADLDFTGEIWPTSLMYGNFSGSIEGNGHTFSNIAITQTNNSKVNAGLFGYLTENAKITDLQLENVTFTIQSGTRVAGTSYGLFAGSASANATVDNVTIANSSLLISSECYFGVDDYVIGLVCGMGSVDIDPSGITAGATGDNAESMAVTVTDGMVTVGSVSE